MTSPSWSRLTGPDGVAIGRFGALLPHAAKRTASAMIKKCCETRFISNPHLKLEFYYKGLSGACKEKPGPLVKAGFCVP